MLHAHYHAVHGEPNREETAVQVRPCPFVTDSLGPVAVCDNTAHLSSHRWRRRCSSGDHRLHVDLDNGRTAGRLFHDLSLEQRFTWQLRVCSLLGQLHHRLVNLILSIYCSHFLLLYFRVN